MIITMENRFGITNEQINIPFMVNNVPIGVITDVSEEKITVLIWERFIGVEKEFDNILDSNTKSRVTAICIGDKLSEDAKFNMFGLDLQSCTDES